MAIKQSRVVIAKCNEQHLPTIASTQIDLYSLNFKDISFVNDDFIDDMTRMYEYCIEDDFFQESAVLLDDNKVIGYYLYNLLGDFTTAYLSQIYLVEDYRNKGYGKMLLQHFENAAKEKELTRLQLDVTDNNKHAVEFYKRNGYRIEKTKHASGEIRHVMVKDLK